MGLNSQTLMKSNDCNDEDDDGNEDNYNNGNYDT